MSPIPLGIASGNAANVANFAPALPTSGEFGIRIRSIPGSACTDRGAKALRPVGYRSQRRVLPAEDPHQLAHFAAARKACSGGRAARFRAPRPVDGIQDLG